MEYIRPLLTYVELRQLAALYLEMQIIILPLALLEMELPLI